MTKNSNHSFGPVISLSVCVLALVLSSCGKAPEGALPSSGGSYEAAATDWPTYGGQPGSTQYSALDQINTKTVRRLEVAWTYHTGELAKRTDTTSGTIFEVTPIFANDRLYFCTPYNNVVALDPASGEQYWRHEVEIDRQKAAYYLYNRCRGVSYWQSAETSGEKCSKRIFSATGDGFLLALDAETGAPCTDFGDNGRIDVNGLDYKGEGYVNLTSPPAIYKNAVIIGASIYDNRWRDTPDGIVRAFDAVTGRELWNWNPIPARLSDKLGGANAWAPLSIDRENGLVFLPTGSPSHDLYGVLRSDPIPDANAIVALDALTGERVWSFQTVHHDLWDYDLPSAPTLVNVRRDGRDIPAVLQATKTGFLFLLDRLTGEPIFPVEEQKVPAGDIPGEHYSPTQPVPQSPPPFAAQELTAKKVWGALLFDKLACEQKVKALRNEGIFTPPSEEGSLLLPSFVGGSNWGGVAYDQRSGLAVVNSSNLVAYARLTKRADDGVAAGATLQGAPYAMDRNFLRSPLGAPQPAALGNALCD